MRIRALGLTLVLSAFPAILFAAYRVDSPFVEKGVLALESRNHFDDDDRPAKDNLQGYQLQVKYGFTDRFALELKTEGEDRYNRDFKFYTAQIEGDAQLTKKGEYWADMGARVFYLDNFEYHKADKVGAKFLLYKEIGPVSNWANFRVDKEIGPSAHKHPEFTFLWRSRYNIIPQFNPGFEMYDAFGEINNTGGWNEQKHQIGPVFFGKLGDHVKYDVGYLRGFSKAATDNVIKVNLEYALPLSF